MPLKIHVTTKQPPIRTARGQAFDAAILKLGPTIAELQAVECPAIHEHAEQLNKLGFYAPSGNPFSYGTMRRVLIRLAQLGLCSGPVTLSASRERRERRIARYRDARLAEIAEKYKK